MGEPVEKPTLADDAANARERFAAILEEGKETGEFGSGLGDEAPTKDAFGVKEELTPEEEAINLKP